MDIGAFDAQAMAQFAPGLAMKYAIEQQNANTNAYNGQTNRITGVAEAGFKNAQTKEVKPNAAATRNLQYAEANQRNDSVLTAQQERSFYPDKMRSALAYEGAGTRLRNANSYVFEEPQRAEAQKLRYDQTRGVVVRDDPALAVGSSPSVLGGGMTPSLAAPLASSNTPSSNSLLSSSTPSSTQMIQSSSLRTGGLPPITPAPATNITLDMTPSSGSSGNRGVVPAISLDPTPGVKPLGGNLFNHSYADERLPEDFTSMHFARGTARVPGKGAPTKDTVKAKLAPGEAVLNAAAAETLGRHNIQALNDHGARMMGMPARGGLPARGPQPMMPHMQAAPMGLPAHGQGRVARGAP